MIRLARLLGLAAILGTPLLSFAAGGLVPCDGPDCDLCSIVTLAHNGLNFLIFISTIIATILFVYAGFQILYNSSNSGKISQARSMFTDVLVGFIILLASWLIVDTVMRTLFTSQQFQGAAGVGQPWSEILCYYRSVTPEQSEVPEPVLPGLPPGGSGFNALDDLNVSDTGMCAVGQTTGCACANNPSGTCSVSGSLAVGLAQLGLAIPGLVVTEAYPPTLPTCAAGQTSGCHFNTCHAAGTCIDLRDPGGLNHTGTINVLASSETSGLRAVYEVSDVTQARLFARDLIEDPRFSTRFPGVTAAQIDTMDQTTLESTFNFIDVIGGGHITGPHFSIYGPQ